MTPHELLAATMYLAPFTHGDKTPAERADDALKLALAVDKAVEAHLAPPAPPVVEEPPPPAPEEAPEPHLGDLGDEKLESVPPSAP